MGPCRNSPGSPHSSDERREACSGYDFSKKEGCICIWLPDGAIEALRDLQDCHRSRAGHTQGASVSVCEYISCPMWTERRERKRKGTECLHTHGLVSGMATRGSAPVSPLLLWRVSEPAAANYCLSAKPPPVAIREHPAVTFWETRRAMASSGPFQIKSEANPSSNSNLVRAEDWSQLPL